MSEQKQPPFTEEDWEKALANASFFTKQRFLKKISKVKYRASYFGKAHDEPKEGQAGVRFKRLPPSNLEDCIFNFVMNNKDKKRAA